MALLLTATFQGKCAVPPPVGLHGTKSHPAAVRKRQPWIALTRALACSQPSYNGCSQKDCGRLSAKEEESIYEKKFIYRNGKAAQLIRAHHLYFKTRQAGTDYYHAWKPLFSHLRATKIYCIITLESHHYI
ncbi:MAG: hypothetical protein K2J99_02860 [Lachnospiraceae bacterium]|nr:hypothetical protein [Lachnospiraceae bacterium]